MIFPEKEAFMSDKIIKQIFLIGFFIFFISGISIAAETKNQSSFFNSSLHYTTRGMAYWYDKENGGLETHTGLPYLSGKLDCVNCHIGSCDVCHKTIDGNKAVYTVKAARNQDVCLNCHKRERTIMKIDSDNKQQDVHFSKGMQCMDCHTARDVHGDGKEYNSMKQTGAIDAKCENCHQVITETTAHKIHNGRLDCNACHVRHVVSCSNCHFETLVNDKKRVDMKLSGWTFLINYNGQVTAGTMQTYVLKDNKTFLMFAPQNSHSIMKEGRKCADCHGSDNAKKAQSGSFILTWLENGELKQSKGVIPVAEGVQYNFVPFNYINGKWEPFEKISNTGLHYAGYGSPLTKEQLRKLSTPMGKE